MNPKQDPVLKRKLAEYAIAEDRGVSLLSEMLTFAPSEEERAAIQKQMDEEIKHSRLFDERAQALNAGETRLVDSLQKLYELGQSCVDERDWVKCITCQNMIEELAIVSFSSIYTRADEETKAVLTEIMAEENEHLDFTLEQLGKWAIDEAGRAKVKAVQDRALEICMEAFRPGQLEKEISAEEANAFKKVLWRAYQVHKERFRKIGLEVPSVSSLVF